MKKSGVIFTAKKRKLPGLLFFILLPLALLFFFPFKQKGIPTPQKASAESAQHVVSVQNMQFNPSQLTIPADTTVVWTNQEGNIPHTVTSDNGLWDSGILQPGQSFSHTFSTPGTYTYHCAIHPFMHGTIVVTGNAYTSPSYSANPSPQYIPYPRGDMPMPNYTAPPSPLTYYPPQTTLQTPSAVQTQSQSQSIHIVTSSSSNNTSNAEQNQSQSQSIMVSP